MSGSQHQDCPAPGHEQCQLCPEILPQDFVMFHYEDYHKVVTPTSPSSTTSTSTCPQGVKCYFCTQSFGTKTQRNSHVWRHHKDLAKMVWMRCNNCLNYFATRPALKFHLNTCPWTIMRDQVGHSVKQMKKKELFLEKVKEEDSEDEEEDEGIPLSNFVEKRVIEDPLAIPDNPGLAISDLAMARTCLPGVADRLEMMPGPSLERVPMMDRQLEMPGPSLEHDSGAIRVLEQSPGLVSDGDMPGPSLEQAPGLVSDMPGPCIEQSPRLVSDDRKSSLEQDAKVAEDMEVSGVAEEEDSVVGRVATIKKRSKIGDGCQYCPFSSQDKELMVGHVNQNHYELAKVKWLDCRYCSRLYPDSRMVSVHETKCKLIFRLSPKSDLTWEQNKVRTCHICNRTFRSRRKAMNHIRSEHESSIQDWLACKHCSQKYPTRRLLNFHQYQCKVKIKQAGHVRNAEQEIKCTYCPMVFRFKKFWYPHIRTKHYDQIKDKWFRCTGCSRLYPRYKVLRHHSLYCKGVLGNAKKPNPKIKAIGVQNIKVEQEEATNVVVKQEPCEEAPVGDTMEENEGSEVDDPCELSKNEDTTNDDSNAEKVDKKPFKCDFCDLTFRRKHHWYPHVRETHMDLVRDDWVPCTRCQTLYPTRSVVTQHVFFCRGKDLDNNADKSTCPFCSQTFRAGQKRLSHIRLMHYDRIKDAWFQCSACGQLYPDTKSLYSHKFICKNRDVKDDDKITCLHCPDTFLARQINLYTLHMTTSHPEENPDFTCGLCGQGPYPCDVLFKHWQGCLETRMKAVACKYCPDKEFTTDLAIRHHVERNHPGEQDKQVVWPCDLCQVKFKSFSDLASHQEECFRSGSGTMQDLLTVCRFCRAAFFLADNTKQMSLFYKHNRSKHAQILVQHWIPCQDCKDLFPSSKAVEQHQFGCQSASPLDPAAYCLPCDQAFESPFKYYEHMSKDHLDDIQDVWLACDKCQVYFPEKDQLEDHRQGCLGSSRKEKVCDHCGKRLARGYYFFQHMQRYHLDKILGIWRPCRFCKQLLPQDSMAKHASCCPKRTAVGIGRNALGVDESLDEELDGEAMDRLKRVGRKAKRPYTVLASPTKCLFCPDEFYASHLHYRHVHEMHLDESRTVWQACRFCGNTYPPDHEVKKVLKNHERLCERNMLKEEAKNRVKSEAVMHEDE